MANLRSFLLAPLFLAAACAADVDGSEQDLAAEDDVEFTELAIGEASCRTTAAPDATFTGGIVRFSGTTPLPYVSPTTYNNPGCFKAVVVRVNNYSSAYVASGSIRPGGVEVAWGEAEPSTEQACKDAWVKAYAYELQSDGTWKEVEVREQRGTWLGAPSDLFGSGCVVPAVNLISPKARGTYKFAGTARTSISGPTRKVTLQSVTPIH